jgi:MerR family redox-sensitive transcriptional activator SoxR
MMETMSDLDANLTIGAVAERAGVATSTLRYYEHEGLISSSRTPAGQRRYRREVLRRIAFIRSAQRIGLSLDEIRSAVDSLPRARCRTKADWARLGRQWKPRLDAEIASLVRLRDQLTSCIGCGCLSLKSCALYNPDDEARDRGPGARYLLGDPPPSPDRA